jgi:hypothetical protein
MPILFPGDYNDYSRNANLTNRHEIIDMSFRGSNIGPALDFSSSGAELNSTAIVTYPCSMELIITPSTLAIDQFIVSFPDIGDNSTQPFTCIYLDSSNEELQITSTNTGYRRGANISGWSAGETHHIIIVWYYDPDTDADSCDIWLDGRLSTFASQDYWFAGEQTNGINFGHRNGDTANDYTGVIDSIKIWNRGLTAEEVIRLANDPWVDYREDMLLPYYGAINGEAPAFSPFWIVGNNQIL